MGNQTFDFETFRSLYGAAMEGLSDTISSLKQALPHVQDVADQTNSDKLSKMTDNYLAIAEEQIACFNSVQTSVEEAQNYYNKFDEAVN